MRMARIRVTAMVRGSARVRARARVDTVMQLGQYGDVS